MNRRELLKALGLSITTTPFLLNQAWATSNQSGVNLVVVFLRGAYDGLNCLVPNSDFYTQIRPNIGLKKETLLPFNSDFGVNPALLDNAYVLLQKQQLCFVHACGSQDNTRSHFESQDFMEMGQSLGTHNYSSGFLGRLIEVISTNAISFTGNSPLIFKGVKDVPNASISSINKSHLTDKDNGDLAQMYENSKLEDVYKEGVNIKAEMMADLQNEMKNSSRGANGGKAFIKQMNFVSEVINQNNGTVCFMDIGGWDTHINQGAEKGVLSNNLTDLGSGILQLSSSLGNNWNKTVVVVMSEFGRTAKENGNRGTDHGHGNVLWVAGGGLRGNIISGDWIDFSEENLHENRDLQVLNDYRSVYIHILHKLYQFNNNQLNKVFPNAPRGHFDII